MSTKFNSRRFNNRFFDEGDNNGGTGTGTGEGGGTGGGGTGGGGTGGSGTGNGGGSGGGSGSGTGERRFSQEEVNRMMKADRDKAKTERDKVLADLQAWKDQGLTPENMDVLNQRIETLVNEGKTKEELAKEAMAKRDKEWEGKLKKSNEQGTAWEGRYKTFRSKSAIVSAAASAKAHNAEQVYSILNPMTQIVEEVGDDGKPTGEFVPRVKFPTTDNGKTVVLELSVEDAIKRMTEMPEHMNLFESEGSGGLGAGNRGRQAGGTTAVPKDMKAYYEQRRKDPAKLRAAIAARKPS